MLILAIIFSYLLGSLSSAIIVCKLMRLPDPRTQGSRNPGATNVLRIGGKKAAFLTLIGDTLKGFLPVWAAWALGFDDTALGMIAIAAFLGHLFPIFFRFQGGKGVATALGCLIALNWPAGVCWIMTWLLIAFLFRYSSLSALIASIFAPFYMAFFTGNEAFILSAALMSVIIIIKHKQNIINLWSGKEKKI